MSAGHDDVPAGLRTVVLVEGVSDRLAVLALAARWDRDLAAEGIAVLPMQGATNIGHFLRRYGPNGLDVGLAGLCDAARPVSFKGLLSGQGWVRCRPAASWSTIGSSCATTISRMN